MATVELTLEQLRDAIIQLSTPQRRKLLADLKRLPSAEEARAAARRMRNTFRMAHHQRKRMGELLTKGNEGTLTLEESRELDTLVDQFEGKTLELARELTRSRKAS